MKIMRWLGSNLTSLILSLLLALVVWISAVTSANPNTEAEFVLPLEVVQQASNIAIIDELPESVFVKILAPESIIQQLEEDNPLFAFIDLSEITAGTYRFPVQIDIPDLLTPCLLYTSDAADESSRVYISVVAVSLKKKFFK